MHSEDDYSYQSNAMKPFITFHEKSQDYVGFYLKCFKQKLLTAFTCSYIKKSFPIIGLDYICLKKISSQRKLHQNRSMIGRYSPKLYEKNQ